MSQAHRDRRRIILLTSILAVVVVLIIGAGIGFAYWQQSRSTVDPATLKVTVTDASGATVELTPYQSCSLGEDCPEGGEPARVSLPAEGNMKIQVPDAVTKGSWQLLTIYEDAAKNDEQLFKAGEKDTVEVAGAKDGSRLTVAEIHAVIISGSGDSEDVSTVVWAIAPTE